MGPIRLKVETDVHAHLQGIGTLGEVTSTAGGAALYSKGVVFRICQVTSPQADNHRTEVIVSVDTQQGIELLAKRVGLIPPDLSLT